jgi:hypothetical protein
MENLKKSPFRSNVIFLRMCLAGWLDPMCRFVYLNLVSLGQARTEPMYETKIKWNLTQLTPPYN